MRHHLVAIFIFIISLSLTAQAASLSGYAWSENIGWIKFQGPNASYGVAIDETTGALSGYAWSENLGWIKFNPAGPYPAAPTHSAALDLNDNIVKGWARVCSGAESGCAGRASLRAAGWDGWIRMAGDDWGISQAGNQTSGCFLNGYAWGSTAVGWIKFGGQNYQVLLDQCVTPTQSPPTSNLGCTFTASPTRVIAPNNTSRLSWSCTDAVACAISPGLGSVNAAAGTRNVRPSQTTTYTLTCNDGGAGEVSYSRTVTVIRSTICETIPWFPGCP